MIAQRLAVIGLGLIGGSVARALRAAGAVERCVGFDVDAGQREVALTLGVVDEAPSSAAAAVAGAQIVVLAVPVLEVGDAIAAIRQGLSAQAVITDVGSTKNSVIAAVKAALGAGAARFVPGHPIAGTEKSGVAASSASLFQGQRVVLTPDATTDAEALERVQAMWQACGARVETMSAEHHDAVFAATSHLPHVLAFALVELLSRMDSHRDLFRFAAGGFRDFTRIASSSPKMWHDIVRANRAALLPVLDRYLATLQGLRAAIDAEDSAQIMHVFHQARGARERYLERGDAEPKVKP